MNEYLSRVGFFADPFESTNSETEENLPDYFVPPPYFSTVLGDPTRPASYIVLAPRGSGKTAQRRMIEAASIRRGDFLCVTYDRFDQPTGFRTADADLNYHLNQICRLILLGVLLRLEEDESLVELLTSQQKDLLKFQVQRFLGSLSMSDYEHAMKAIKNLGDRIGDVWKKYGGVIAVGIQALMEKVGLNVATTTVGPVSEARHDDGLQFHFQKLIDVANTLWDGSVYVLVDKTDEIPLTSANSHEAYALIRSLITDLPTLETPGVGFKFFLWDHIADEYRQTGGRPDRVQITELQWTVDELHEMLRQRLLVFSNKKIESLNALLCDGVDIDLDRLIAHFAQGSPRDLIRSAKSIIAEATKTSTDIDCVSEADIWSGLRAFSNAKASELGSTYLPELRKVNAVTFTTNYVSNDVYHVDQNSGRARIQKWLASGIVEQVGTIPNPKGRPFHLYGIADLRVAVAALNEIDVDLILGNYVLLCPDCGSIVISQEKNPTCQKCNRDFGINAAASLLAHCTFGSL